MAAFREIIMNRNDSACVYWSNLICKHQAAHSCLVSVMSSKGKQHFICIVPSYSKIFKGERQWFKHKDLFINQGWPYNVFCGSGEALSSLREHPKAVWAWSHQYLALNHMLRVRCCEKKWRRILCFWSLSQTRDKRSRCF